MKDDLPDDAITTGQAANLIHQHPSTIFRWIMKGKIAGWKTGSRYLVSRADVLALVQRVPVEKKVPLPAHDVAAIERWAEAAAKKMGLL